MKNNKYCPPKLDNQEFIAWAFDRHCNSPHNADYEVCDDAICKSAYWLENRPAVTWEKRVELLSALLAAMKIEEINVAQWNAALEQMKKDFDD